MEPIRVVWGTGTGPTALAAHDAALAGANIHQYNLIELSSVIPPNAEITESSEAPDLGATGHQLPVVLAADTTQTGAVSAALVWARTTDGAGIFYEAAGPSDSAVIVDRAQRGITAGMARRAGSFGAPSTRVATTHVDPGTDRFGAAVVAAVYGRGRPLLAEP